MPYDPFGDPFALDPFAFDLPDPFAPPGRRRPAAYPVLPEPEAAGLIDRIGGAALSGLGLVGSVLDQAMGGRAIRGVLGGNPRELLSIVPFSDNLGLTSEADRVSGKDLLGRVGLDTSQVPFGLGWVPDVAAEIALDPSTWLGGVGALTKAGKAAQKAGSLARGLLPAVAAGERSLHPLLALAPASLQADVGAIPGRALGAAGSFARNLPRVGPAIGMGLDLAGEAGAKVGSVARGLFDHRAGFVADPLVQEAHEFGYLPKQADVARSARGPIAGLYGRYADIMGRHGLDDRAAWENLTRQIELPQHLRPAGTAIDAEMAALADEIRPLYEKAIQDELALGVKSPRLTSRYDLEYATRQATKAPEGERSLMRRLFGTGHPSQRRRLDYLDTPGGTVQLQEWIEDPAFSAAARTPMGRKAVAQALANELEQGWLALNQVGPPNVPAFEKQGKRLARFLGQIKDEYIRTADNPDPLAFWRTNPIDAVLTRGMRSATAQAGAEGVYETLRRAQGKGLVSAGGGVNLARLIDRSGLGGPAAFEHALRAIGEDPAALVAAANAGATAANQLPPDPARVLRQALGQRAIPEDLAKSTLKLATRYASPEEVGPVVAALDRLNRMFRTGVYTIFPAPHVRNWASGEFENFLNSGTLGPLDPAARIARAALKGDPIDLGIPGYAGLPGDEQRAKLIGELFTEGVVNPLNPQGQVNDLFGVRVQSIADANPLTPKELNPLAIAARELGGAGTIKEKLAAVPEIGRGVGRSTEDYLRTSQYVKLLQDGWDPRAAAAHVEATHFDYQRLTDFEKNVMRRVFPFYTFTRRNFPKQLQRAAERPATVQAPIRAAEAMRGEEGYVPNYLEEAGLPIPLPVGLGDGTTRYLSGLGLPFEEAFGRIRPGANPLETAAKSLLNVLGMMRPEAKYPLEVATNTQFYSGRKLSDLHPGGLLSAFPDDVAGPLAQVLANTPATRVISTINRLADPRKYQGDPLDVLLGLGLPLASGVRTTDVDAEKWRAIDARDALEKVLAAQPNVRRSVDFWVRPEDRALVTPEQEALLRLQATLKANAREAARERRAGQGG